MKRLLLILLVMLPFLVRGQNASWKFFDRYTKAEGFTSVQLERKMMRMMRTRTAILMTKAKMRKKMKKTAGMNGYEAQNRRTAENIKFCLLFHRKSYIIPSLTVDF